MKKKISVNGQITESSTKFTKIEHNVNLPMK